MRFLSLATFFAVWVVATAPVAAFETAAKAAILIDHRHGDVLFAKNPDEPIEPASMSKLMTALMAFEELKAGTLGMDQRLPVSERAWRMGGSRMFVEVNTRVAVRDLLRGIIVQSGNDACIVIAEALAGSEEAFAQDMNERARELGFLGSHFKNATGWPDPEHLMTVRDLASIARRIISEYPEFYDFYSIKEFTYNDIHQYNRNPLLQADVDGVDGMKTGYTRAAGYGLVATAERDQRRLILVVAGLESPSERRNESERLLEYGFRNFAEYRMFEPNETIIEVPVWHGGQPTVSLVGQDVVSVTMQRALREELEVHVSYDSPVIAPINAGQKLGEMVMQIGPGRTLNMPLVAAEDVPRASVAGRMMSTFNYLVWGTPEG